MNRYYFFKEFEKGIELWFLAKRGHGTKVLFPLSLKRNSSLDYFAFLNFLRMKALLRAISREIMEIKSTSQIVYERILEIFNKTKSPVSLYSIYELCRRFDELSTRQIRSSLKWLFDNGFLKWEKEGRLIPQKEVMTYENIDQKT